MITCFRRVKAFESVVDDEAVECAPDVSAATADTPLVPHVPSATFFAYLFAHVQPAPVYASRSPHVSVTPTRRDHKRGREYFDAMVALGKAYTDNKLLYGDNFNSCRRFLVDRVLPVRRYLKQIRTNLEFTSRAIPRMVCISFAG